MGHHHHHHNHHQHQHHHHHHHHHHHQHHHHHHHSPTMPTRWPSGSRMAISLSRDRSTGPQMARLASALHTRKAASWKSVQIRVSPLSTSPPGPARPPSM